MRHIIGYKCSTKDGSADQCSRYRVFLLISIIPICSFSYRTLFSGAHIACLILLIFGRHPQNTSGYVHETPLTDTRVSYNCQPPPKFFPTEKGDFIYDDNVRHWYQSVPEDDSMDDSDDETEAPMDQNDSPTDPLPPPVFDYDEEMDFDEPPQFTSTSTPRANRNDQQPSTSGTQSIRTSSSSSSYHRDLHKSTPIQINILVPRFPNFNGRTCHFISTLKAVLFCWKEKNENIPRPNAGKNFLQGYYVKYFGTMQIQMRVSMWNQYGTVLLQLI